MDIDPTAEIIEVEKAVRSCLHEESISEVKVSMTKRPFRGTRKAFINLEEARALRLMKATHIKIGWVSCRVRRRIGAAGSAAQRGTLRLPTRANRNATSAPREEETPGSTIYRGLRGLRLFERQPRRGGREKLQEEPCKLTKRAPRSDQLRL